MHTDTSIYLATDALPVFENLIHIYTCITITNIRSLMPYVLFLGWYIIRMYNTEVIQIHWYSGEARVKFPFITYIKSALRASSQKTHCSIHWAFRQNHYDWPQTLNYQTKWASLHSSLRVVASVCETFTNSDENMQ